MNFSNVRWASDHSCFPVLWETQYYYYYYYLIIYNCCLNPRPAFLPDPNDGSLYTLGGKNNEGLTVSIC